LGKCVFGKLNHLPWYHEWLIWQYIGTVAKKEIKNAWIYRHNISDTCIYIYINLNFISNSYRWNYNLKDCNEIKKINIDLKLQICFHTLKILTIHVISEIDQYYQLYWVLLNNYTLVISIICKIYQHYQPYWALLNYCTLVSIICEIDQHYQLHWALLNYCTLVSIIYEIDQHYQLYWALLNYSTLVSIICEIDQHYQLYWVLLNY
jgi:hypothetical protein